MKGKKGVQLEEEQQSSFKIEYNHISKFTD